MTYEGQSKDCPSFLGLDDSTHLCIILFVMNKLYQCIELTVDDKTYAVDFDADFSVEDVGIGPYEYWGAKCNDVQWDYTCEDVSIAAVHLRTETDDISIEPDAELLKKIERAAMSYVEDNMPEYDGCGGDRYDGYDEDRAYDDRYDS